MSSVNSTEMSEKPEKTEFDLKLLQSRIDQMKEEGKESSEFLHTYITCLVERHDLFEYIPEDLEIVDIPEQIIQKLIDHEIPSVDDLNALDLANKEWLIIQLVWLSGMGSLAVYCEDTDEDDEESTFDAILSMMDVDEAHYVGVYLVAALTLLMCQIPPLELVERLTNDFSEDPEDIESAKQSFYQLSSGIYSRYNEDVNYYSND